MKIIIACDGHSQILVDDDVYEWAKDISWRYRPYTQTTTSGHHRGGASVENITWKQINKVKKHTYRRLSRMVMNVVDPKIMVDHIDGNVLNNQRSNLRLATPHQNAAHRSKISRQNTSGQQGVRFHKETQKWEAYIKKNSKKIHLGIYADKDDAIVARRKAEFELFGEFKPDI